MMNQNYNRNNCNNNNSGNRQQMRSGSSNIRNEKNAAMCAIYELGFVLTETMLFLDTNPENQEALDYYAEMKEKYVKAVEKYSNYFGPVNMMHMSNENYWMWVATPMPWEMEDC